MATTDIFQISKRERVAIAPEKTNYGEGGDFDNQGEVIGFEADFSPSNFSQGLQLIDNSGSGVREIHGYVEGTKDYPFNLSFTPLNLKSLIYILNVVDTGTAPNFTHTFNLGNSINTFGLEISRPTITDNVLKLKGGYVKSLSLSFEKHTGEDNGFVKINMECNAQDHELGTDKNTNIPVLSGNPFRFRHIKFTLNNSELVEVNNGEFTINNEIDENDFRYTNATLDRLKGKPIVKRFLVTGRINVNVKDNDFISKWQTAGIIANTKLELIKNANDNAEFVFKDFRIMEAVGGTGDGVQAVDLVFSAVGFTKIEVNDNIEHYEVQ